MLDTEKEQQGTGGWTGISCLLLSLSFITLLALLFFTIVSPILPHFYCLLLLISLCPDDSVIYPPFPSIITPGFSFLYHQLLLDYHLSPLLYLPFKLLSLLFSRSSVLSFLSSFSFPPLLLRIDRGGMHFAKTLADESLMLVLRFQWRGGSRM